MKGTSNDTNTKTNFTFPQFESVSSASDFSAISSDADTCASDDNEFYNIQKQEQQNNNNNNNNTLGWRDPIGEYDEWKEEDTDDADALSFANSSTYNSNSNSNNNNNYSSKNDVKFSNKDCDALLASELYKMSFQEREVMNEWKEEDTDDADALSFANSSTYNSNSNNNNNYSSKKDVKFSNKDCDALLASELYKMSFQEREVMNEEIHGIGLDRGWFIQHKEIEETPARLASALEGLAEELKKLSLTGTAEAFDRGQKLVRLHPERGAYLNEKDFRLMFLRADAWDYAKAAKRMCLYLNTIRNLFGDQVLQRPIQLKDMNAREMENIEKGYSQRVQGRDRAGRRMYIHFASDTDIVLAEGDGESERAKSRIRVALYTTMSLLEGDVQTQRLGIVYIFFMYDIASEVQDPRSALYDDVLAGGRRSNAAARHRLFFFMYDIKMDATDFYTRSATQSRSGDILPMRVGAAHYCFPVDNYGMMSIILRALSGSILQRVRVHSCSPVECMYTLQSFGIPTMNFPINMATGERVLTNHKKWMEWCVAKESNNGVGAALRKRIIECPRHSDILFGRGHMVMKHPGNTVFRNVIKANLAEYISTKSKKEGADQPQKMDGMVRSEGVNNGVGAALRKRIIECPRHSDILFGRGHMVMKHPGNTVFRNVIKSKLVEYISTKSKTESTKLTWETVRMLKSEYGARFLKEELVETDGLCWVETNNEIARSKVRIAFRDARTRMIRTARKQELDGTNNNIASSTKRNADGGSKGNDINVPPSSRTTALPYLTEQQQQQLFTSPIINFCNSNNNNLNNHDSGFGALLDIAKNSASMLPKQVADSSTSAFLGMDSGGGFSNNNGYAPNSFVEIANASDVCDEVFDASMRCRALLDIAKNSASMLPKQVADSSTSAFLGMDRGGGISKRQRICSQNFCSNGNGFNCF
eukprot:CAMPEP_0168309616 /NCGR_PEP_ID=MMETSP0142_2-20121227/66368_1 /TAXON_ID=44445 /ORGANISM="Pseudo-nitzschia australis, Strain 10249 10 AB" /LENGTH=931 /DNA_ID=CAMNT_0008262345 /DNA_START=116 /DNA_END=2915 /DNA_ORIENTATION=-